MRRISLSLGRVIGYRSGALLMLMAILQLVSLSALAQLQTNMDYYAPRNSKQNQQYTNVTGFHIAPGRQELANRRYGPALAHAEFVLRYYTNHPEALNLLSETCLKWNSPKCDAIADEWFQKAIARNPNAVNTYIVHAIHLHRKDQLKEAVEAYRRALELAPDSVNAHYNIALAYLDLKQYDLANQHAQRSYQLGAFVPGLRTRLEKLGKWNANVSMPVSETKSGSEAATASDAKPASEVKPEGLPVPPAKKPDEPPLKK